MPLKSTRSSLDPRLTLITASELSSEVKLEPTSPSPLRRSARSARSGPSLPPTPTSPLDTKRDLSRYAYADPSPSSRRKRPKLDQSAADDEQPGAVAGPSTPVKNEREEDVKKTPKSSTKKPLPLVALDKPHPAPPRWERQYALIKRMREGIVAPVDTMPCERPNLSGATDPKTLRFHVLISLMLSSQTKDAITAQAVSNLHQTLPGGLTAQSLADATEATVQECINKVGFWRRKTEYIQAAARTLLEREGEDKGDVPKTIEGLCALKGVGPKMAFLCLQAAWDINAGIGVDVHVHRITNRLKWHKPPTNSPEQTRVNLESWLPPHLHKPINPMLVGFGQIICLPVGPRCDLCLLAKEKICPSRVSNVNAAGRKEVVYSFTADGVGEAANGFGMAKLEVGYEDGLVKMEEEPLVAFEDTTDPSVKVDPEVGLERKVERVLEMLDQVDGAREIC